jgi:hypothetical protein
MDAMQVVNEVLALIGYLLRGLGFLVIGFGLARFAMEAFNKAAWQVQIALALGFFGLLIALTDFSTAGSAGSFALGAGIAFLLANMPKKGEEDQAAKKK